MLLKEMAAWRSAGPFGRGDDTVGHPHRAKQLSISSKLDKQSPAEQFEAAVSQSVPSPTLSETTTTNNSSSNSLSNNTHVISTIILIITIIQIVPSPPPSCARTSSSSACAACGRQSQRYEKTPP